MNNIWPSNPNISNPHVFQQPSAPIFLVCGRHSFTLPTSIRAWICLLEKQGSVKLLQSPTMEHARWTFPVMKVTTLNWYDPDPPNTTHMWGISKHIFIIQGTVYLILLHCSCWLLCCIDSWGPDDTTWLLQTSYGDSSAYIGWTCDHGDTLFHLGDHKPTLAKIMCCESMANGSLGTINGISVKPL